MRIQKWIFGTMLGIAYFLSSSCFAREGSGPLQPSTAADPGSSSYSYAAAIRYEYRFEGCIGSFYYPKDAKGKLPLQIFAHGHLAPEIVYYKTFIHLARKGISVLYVPYNCGLNVDQVDLMIEQFHNWTVDAISRFASIVDNQNIVYTGHSLGAEVAADAAGKYANDQNAPKALVFFGIGDADEQLKGIKKDVKVSLIVGDQDSVTPYSVSLAAFNKIPAKKKQIIQLHSYDNYKQKADHGSIRTLGFLGDQEGPLHWFGYWRYMVAASLSNSDAKSSSADWLYGAGAINTGSNFNNNVLRSGF